MSEVKDHVEAAMNVAMEIIAGGNELSPVVVFFKRGMPNLPIPLELDTEEGNTEARKLVKAFILTFRPDFAVMVTDAWMLSVEKTPEVDLDKLRDHYKPGDASRHPHRVETIVVDGAGIGEKHSALQPYTRKGKKIVFLERPVLPENGYVDNAFFDNAWEILEKEGKVVH
jgi:hypothetical protein